MSAGRSVIVAGALAFVDIAAGAVCTGGVQRALQAAAESGDQPGDQRPAGHGYQAGKADRVREKSGCEQQGPADQAGRLLPSSSPAGLRPWTRDCWNLRKVWMPCNAQQHDTQYGRQHDEPDRGERTDDASHLYQQVNFNDRTIRNTAAVTGNSLTRPCRMS